MRVFRLLARTNGQMVSGHSICSAMRDTGETKALVKKFSDKARKTKRVGNKFFIPHKFTPEGKVVTPENFNVLTDLSQLNLSHLRFLELWQSQGWDNEKTLTKCGLAPDIAEKTFKRLAYFKTEDATIKVLAARATPEAVLAKDVRNIEEINPKKELSDSKHKSLERVSKVLGMFKSSDISITQNVFNLPSLTPEVEAKFKALAEEALEAEVA